MGQAFQNQQEQKQELTALLEECEKEAEELANLVRNKDEVVKNLERRLLNAKKVIAELRAEVRCRKPTRATRRPTCITTATPADGRHSHQHPEPGQHTRTI